ncbi:MAG: Wzz/FepE/Etk N-terminal domain-containing protein, partial [Candidatus Sumerlaeota bacterium]|nr:Wzz/FepE/Etk N-terminal domain-containing protein [Candidatus Sumerlaeota bacterium]
MATQHSRFAGLREYLRVFFSHLWLIALVVVVVVAAAAVATLTATPVYTAVAKVQAKPPAAATPFGAAGYPSE